MEPSLVATVLARLGVPAAAPSAAALTRLHRAWVEHVPYETVWLHQDEPWGIDPAESLARVAGGRGGYCFQQNGALALVLDHLGYRVTRHRAAVHEADGPTEADWGNHLALVVHDLATAGHPGGRWYADAGLGDVLHDPLPMVAGEHRQGLFTFGLDRAADGTWRFDARGQTSFAGVGIGAEVADETGFAERHRFNATSPDSGFARTVTAQRRMADGTDCLRGVVLTRRRFVAGEVVTTTTTFTDRSAWQACLHDVFGIRPGPDLGPLWERMRTVQDERDATVLIPPDEAFGATCRSRPPPFVDRARTGHRAGRTPEQEPTR